MKMDTAYFSEMSAKLHDSEQCHILEDSNLQWLGILLAFY
jgi:hypothetical protein